MTRRIPPPPRAGLRFLPYQQLGVYRAGDLADVCLLLGGMLLLLAVLKARDAALRPPAPPAEN